MIEWIEIKFNAGLDLIPVCCPSLNKKYFVSL